MEDLLEWLERGSVKNGSLLEALSQVDLSLEQYDRMFLGGKKMSPKGNTWKYPFGSVYFRLTKTGIKRWYIYYRSDEERKRECVKGAQTRADALKVLQAKVVDLFREKHGFNRLQKRTKLKEFAGVYIESYAKVNKRTWRDDVYTIGKFEKFFGDSYLQDITILDIEKFKASRLKDGVTGSSINRNLALLKKMFNLAIDWGYCESNPVRRVKFFSEKDNVKERILSLDEERMLLAQCSEHLKPIVVMAIHTGMRRGEILNLTWDQVDFDSEMIRVEKTKSGKIRFIPINSRLQTELIKLKALSGHSEYVFLGPRYDKPLTEIKTAFNGATRRAGIQDLRFHDLRHTFASRLIGEGVDIVTVQSLLGHHSVVVTQRYTHSNEVQKRKAVECLASKLQEAPGSVPTVSTRKGSDSVTPLFTVN